jgi:DNA-binding NtrC family response regulator
MRDSYVLFVEDSALCAMETGETLRDHGFDVLQARCAREAMLMIDSHKDLLALLTDIDLGAGLDGFDVARHARVAMPDLPVVYMSGAENHRFEAEGVCDSEFIAKPYRRQRVIEALNRVIAHGT